MDQYQADAVHSGEAEPNWGRQGRVNSRYDLSVSDSSSYYTSDDDLGMFGEDFEDQEGEFVSDDEDVW